MPRKPKRPCAYPGCARLTDGRFCAEHAKRRNREYEALWRDKEAKKKYGRGWRRIRDRYAAEHPICENCFSRGIIRQTEEIHHIRPLKEGGGNESGNLIALCKSCHSSIHLRRNAGMKRGEGGVKSPDTVRP